MAKPELFSPGFGPDALWRMSPLKRKIDLSGLLSPEDSVLAIARGMQPSFALRALEDRAVIKGGLMVLAGVGAGVDVTPLKVTILNLPKDDTALLRAAGYKGTGDMGKRLSAAASVVKARVTTAGGKGLERAAWGARGLLILGVMPGLLLAHSAAAMAANLVPGVGQVISAAAMGHISITQAIAKNVARELNADLKQGLATAKAAIAKKSAEKQTASRLLALTPPATSSAFRTWAPWVGGGIVLLLLGGAFMISQKKE